MPDLEKLAKLIRYYCLTATTEAGSGHPTSALSATDLMTVLFFGGFFHYDIADPQKRTNDRLIFSKGHASPLFYALWAAAGGIETSELMTLRKFGSRLEGHPTLAFPFTEAPTGSLGQGLSIGLGMALDAKYLAKISYKTFVLLGDSEMAEGSNWEALALARHYKLNNLIGIIDVNRLGQRGETMDGHQVEEYQKKVSGFGWETIVIDGHSFEEITEAFKKACAQEENPVMIISKTIKGKGISFLEDQNGWHGKALGKEDLEKALHELGEVDLSVRGVLAKPEVVDGNAILEQEQKSISSQVYKKGTPVATRKAYGNALSRLMSQFSDIVVLDAETGNSTYAEDSAKVYPERFFEMYIAEQNMIGAAVGLSKREYIPFVSTFAAFLTRAFDQIRMAAYAQSHIVVAGSHAGVSIGEDGASQMGLEDIAMLRTIFGSVILYPSDAVSTEKLVEEAVQEKGIVYIRTTRMATPVLYDQTEKFVIGGSKVHGESSNDQVTIVGAGVTLHEALTAQKMLKEEGVAVRVIDLYSIKPLDITTLKKAAEETKALIIVEDHYEAGGISEAVRSGLADVSTPIISLAVRKLPKSGSPKELLDYEEISVVKIVAIIKELLAAK